MFCTMKPRRVNEACDRLITGLVSLRRQRGLIQKEVAARMGISQPKVSVFKQHCSNPTADSVVSYAQALSALLRSKNRW